MKSIKLTNWQLTAVQESVRWGIQSGKLNTNSGVALHTLLDRALVVTAHISESDAVEGGYLQRGDDV